MFKPELLAPTKQGRGKPVAQVDVETVDVYSNYIQWLTEDLPIHGTKLYTSAPTIPEGWQLVPITPDWNMQMAGIRKLEHCTNGELECIGEKLLDSLIKHTSEIYTAMIAAAPKPEE